MKTPIALLGVGLLLGITSLYSATTTIDFSATDFAGNNLTAGMNSGNLSFDSGTMRINFGSSLAGLVTYNNVFPSAVNTDDFSVKVDGKFTNLNGGGDSVGIITNNTGGASALSGYVGIFRILSTTSADFRLFEGVNTTTGSLGTNLTTTALTISGAFVADTFYTFSLAVDVTSSSSVTFSASILNASNSSVIGTFTSVVDNSASLGDTTNKIGLRLGTNGSVTNYTTVDNLQLITAAIPEPSTFALLGGLGALGLAAIRRRRR
ncbi:MAG: PEP-CTERM sorting domain-containing protein [Opitutaceae bacterium]